MDFHPVSHGHNKPLEDHQHKGEIERIVAARLSTSNLNATVSQVNTAATDSYRGNGDYVSDCSTQWQWKLQQRSYGSKSVSNAHRVHGACDMSPERQGSIQGVPDSSREGMASAVQDAREEMRQAEALARKSMPIISCFRGDEPSFGSPKSKTLFGPPFRVKDAKDALHVRVKKVLGDYPVQALSIGANQKLHVGAARILSTPVTNVTTGFALSFSEAAATETQDSKKPADVEPDSSKSDVQRILETVSNVPTPVSCLSTGRSSSDEEEKFEFPSTSQKDEDATLEQDSGCDGIDHSIISDVIGAGPPIGVDSYRSDGEISDHDEDINMPCRSARTSKHDGDLFDAALMPDMSGDSTGSQAADSTQIAGLKNDEDNWTKSSKVTKLHDNISEDAQICASSSEVQLPVESAISIIKKSDSVHTGSSTETTPALGEASGQPLKASASSSKPSSNTSRITKKSKKFSRSKCEAVLHWFSTSGWEI